MSQLETDQSRWFSENVEPHEPQLRAYLRNSFPSIRDVDDIIQETYVRLLRSGSGEDVTHPKAFLFTIARRVALNFVKRQQRSPEKDVGEWDFSTVSSSERDSADSASRAEILRILVEALASLPPRCREITVKRKIKGIPQKEIAAEMGISVKTVEEQVARGVRKCERFMRKRGISNYFSR